MRIPLLLLAAFPAVLFAAEPAADDEAVVAFMTANCYACHDPQAAEGSRVAPPMIGVKRHYLDAGLDRDGFIEAIAGFVREPSVQTSLMPGAVRRFGLMPRQSYDEAMIRRLAAFLYDNEIDQPDWFETHYRNRSQRRGQGGPRGAALSAERPAERPAERGQVIADATRAQLGRNLRDALNSEGAAHAVAFCSEQALPITAEMEAVHGANIRRVSDRPRNPANAADAAERAYIAQFQAAIDAGRPLPPLVTTQGSVTTTYLPIVTNAMCLQCHGSVDGTIQPETLARIQTLYPEDRATGYGERQVRGIWRIRWED